MDDRDLVGSPITERIEEALFLAWRRGDKAAQRQAYTDLWRANYTWVVRFCRTFVPDMSTAEQVAADALTVALDRLSAKVQSPGFYWEGPAQFAGMFVKQIKFRCKDERRKWLAARRLFGEADASVDGQNGEGGESPEPSPEETVLEIEQTRSGIAAVVRRLGEERWICRDRKALVEFIEAQREYLRECCVRAIEGVDTTGLELDALIPLLRTEVPASFKEMNLFIMRRLEIERDALYQRRLEIRQYLEAARKNAGRPRRSAEAIRS